MDIDAFWKPWEVEVATFKEAVELIHDTFDAWSSQGNTFVWRGHVDASWPLHSSLYRRVMWTNGVTNAPPDEATFAIEEATILAEVHKWGLHTGGQGRLSAMSQLAVLQHYGAPTRLIDVTFNPLIGLWFAVEEQWENGSVKNEERDGRLFAIDVSDRLVNENEERRYGKTTRFRRGHPSLRRNPSKSGRLRFSRGDRRGLTTASPHKMEHSCSGEYLARRVLPGLCNG